MVFYEGFDEDANGDGSPDGWSVQGDVSIDTVEGFHGWSLRFDSGPGERPRARSPQIELQPERLYRLSWYCRTQAVLRYVSFGINLGERTLDFEEEHQGNTLPWTEQQALFTTLADETVGRILIQLSDEGAAWVDEVRLERYDHSLSEPGIISENAQIVYREGDSTVVWVNYPVMKIFQDDLLSPALPDVDTIRVSMAKGECEPFQILIFPSDSLKNVEVHVSQLNGATGIISAENITINTVHCAEVSEQWVHLPGGRAGFYPDALPWENKTDAPTGQHTPFWVTIHMPQDISNGTYVGTISLSGPVSWIFPLKVHVWNFALPEIPSLHATGSDGALLSSAMEHIDHRPAEERLADWFDNMRRHRISGTRYVEGILDDEDWLQIVGDSLEIDFEAFDAKVSEYLAEGMITISLPPSPLASQRRPLGTTLWLGFTPLTEDFNYFFTDYCRQLGGYLESLGLLNRAFMMLWDEPNVENYSDVYSLYSLVRTGHSGLMTMLTEEPVLELYDVVDLWFPNLRRLAGSELQDRFEGRQSLSEFVGAYGNDRYSMIHPLTYIRLWPWTMKLYGLTHTGWYAVLSARLDIWDNPVLPGSPEGYTGKEFPGGGFFLYPEREGDGPFVNSMRWESFRDGMEDFDYLTLLEQRLNLIDPNCSEQGTEIVRDFVGELVWGNFGWEYEPQVSHLYEIRDSVAAWIESLGDPPERVRGDVNSDGEINILDVVLGVSIILG
ncbi:MAG: glycoside hydrolase domain-containing protein [bacterium]